MGQYSSLLGHALCHLRPGRNSSSQTSHDGGSGESPESLPPRRGLPTWAQGKSCCREAHGGVGGRAGRRSEEQAFHLAPARRGLCWVGRAFFIVISQCSSIFDISPIVSLLQKEYGGCFYSICNIFFHNDPAVIISFNVGAGEVHAD